jgi:DNA-binding transcriptional LysR family regulator
VLETDSAALIKSMMGEGNYLSCVPRQFLLAELLRGELVEIDVPEMRMERTVVVVSRKGRVHLASTNLALQACRAVAGKIQA